MLIEAIPPELPAYVIVAESDDLSDMATWLLASLRREEISCEIVQSGSQKKRFEKAIKINPEAIIIINDVLLDSEQIANIRVKRLRGGVDKLWSGATKLENILSNRFTVEKMIGSSFDSGADVRIFPKRFES